MPAPIARMRTPGRPPGPPPVHHRPSRPIGPAWCAQLDKQRAAVAKIQKNLTDVESQLADFNNASPGGATIRS